MHAYRRWTVGYKCSPSLPSSGGAGPTLSIRLRPLLVVAVASVSEVEVEVEVGMLELVQELEEALRESVSITAERELALAQQKQQVALLEARMGQYRDQLGSVAKQYEELGQKVTAIVQSFS